jgi:uncharacterized phiE125 gp8 family phage protein
MTTVLNPVRTVAPLDPPVALEQVRAHEIIDGSAEDMLLREYLDAATEKFDGPSGILGLALAPQTWSQQYTGFSSPICLPVRPVQSVTSITYQDADDATQTLATSVYSLVANHKCGPRIVLKSGQSWPATYSRDDAVTVTFVAGFPSAAAVPHRIKQMIRLLVADWWMTREDSTAIELKSVPNSILSLAANFRHSVV